MSKRIFSFAATALFASLAIAVTPLASSADVCQGSQCQVTFSYTGAPQTWIVPDAATNITFDIQGAAGGRGGGLGGRVTGALTGNYSQLLVYVGGAGQTGALVNGGFNGGGKAGGNRTNEGSGGGASDIRLSASLESRLVVAGGGGGTGGFSGGPGGHGGGEIASAGQAGQGGGGGGGTQVAGGARGSNNGGYVLATAGSFGEGGIGGVSWNAGGGGGGGGWYGGGGGGSDEDDCCGDGGGGGGGSSYASSTDTTNIVHTAGFKSGHGTITISYVLQAQLIEFSGTQLDTDSVRFDLEYNMAITGLEATELLVTGSGCIITSIQTVGNRKEIFLDGCTENPEVQIAPATFEIFSAEPSSTLSSAVQLDHTGPTATFSHLIASNSSIVLSISVSDAVNVISSSSFNVIGCTLASSSTSPEIQLALENCAEGIAIIVLNAGVFHDQFGNLSDTISHQIEFDFSAPILSWSLPIVSLNELFEIDIQLVANEQIQLLPNVIQISGNSPSCSGEITQTGNNHRVQISNCTAGIVQLDLPAKSATDRAGFQGPSNTLSATIQLSMPAAPAPVYSREEGPVQISDPVASASPVVSPDPISDSQVVAPIPIPSNSQTAEVQNAPAAISFSKPDSVTQQPTLSDQQVSSAPIVSEPQEVNLAKPVSLELGQSSNQSPNYLLAGLVVLGLLSLGGAGALLIRLTENNRSRAVK